MAKIIKSLCLSPESEEFVNKHIPNFSQFVEKAVQAELIKFESGDSQESLNKLLEEVYPSFFTRRYNSEYQAKNYITGAHVVRLIKLHKARITPLELYDRLNEKYMAALESKESSRNKKL